MREPSSLESLTSVDVLKTQKLMFIVGFTRPSFFPFSFFLLSHLLCKIIFLLHHYPCMPDGICNYYLVLYVPFMVVNSSSPNGQILALDVSPLL